MMKKSKNKNIKAIHVELVGIRKDLSEVEIEAFFNSISFKGKPALLGIIEDITRRRQLEDSLVIQTNLGIALSAANNLEEITQLCIEAARSVSGMNKGCVYFRINDQNMFNLIHQKNSERNNFQPSSSVNFTDNELNNLTQGKPVYRNRASFNHNPIVTYVNNEIKLFMYYPIIYNYIVIGVILLGSHYVTDLPPPVFRSLELISYQMGAAIQRINFQQELSKNKKIIESLRDASNAAILTFDDKGRIRSWDQGANTIFGYVENEIINKVVKCLFISETWQLFQDKIIFADTDKGTNTEIKPFSGYGITKYGTRIKLEIKVYSIANLEFPLYVGLIHKSFELDAI